MTTCSACGTEATAGQRFCGRCGNPLAAPCPNCGTENPPDHRFCGQCGTVLGGAEPAALPASGPEAPTAAERRVVSVLFIDLVGFTSFSEGRDPEDVRELITRYFDLARDIIERFGGTIDKYIGDAVMAWWGATTSLEDDAERAVRSALELVDRVANLGEELTLSELAARAGVMTGEASVGPGGNHKGLLLGDLVNSTSRLQGLATPGTVLVDRTTADLVAGGIELADAGTHHVKGKDEPIAATRAVRVRAERGGRGRSDLLEPPFVGRGTELRLLKDALVATGRDRRARLVSLVGQAGIGKSRLVTEFRKFTDGLVEDIYWHEGRSPAYGDGVSLWALGEMIRRRAGIGETDDDATTRRLLGESVAAHVPDPDEAAWVEDRLAGLLGVADSAGRDRAELFAAARAFFERLSDKGSVVMVFEDLHWADPSLLEFIEELPDWSQNHPLLVVTMARPDLLDRRPDWGSGRRGLTSLYLGPLADDEMTALIEGAVPGIPPEASDRIVATAGGVPLFAVEMLRMLLGEGRLAAGPEGVTVVGDLSTLEVPTSVQAVIAARLDRLPPEDREVARDAAVLGYSFTIDGLMALRDESVDKLERRLADLVRREILELVRDPRSPERGQYRWVQSLLREVTYARVGRADRHALHLRAGRWFRDLGDVELAPMAAAHFMAAAEQATERGAEFESEMLAAVEGALERAVTLHAHEQVLALVDAAVPVVPDPIAADLHELAAVAAVRLADAVLADRHVAALASLATTDPTLGHRAVALLGLVGNESQRASEVRERLEAHLTAHPDPTVDPDLARAAVYLARSRMLDGDDTGAAVLAHEALGAVERFGLIDEVADAMVTLGTSLVVDRPHHGMALLRGALAVCREHDLTATLIRALINIGYGSPDRAEAAAATWSAFDEAKRVGDKNHAAYAAGNLLGVLSNNLDLDRAEALMADPVIEVDAPSALLGRFLVRASIALSRGDRAAADAQQAEAKRVAEGITDQQVLLGCDRITAEFALADGDFASVYETGVRLYRDTPFLPWGHLGLALFGAALEGNAEWIREIDDAMARLSGTEVGMFRRWAGAQLAIIDGQPEEGVACIESFADEAEERFFRWASVVALAGAARHLPVDHPDRGRLADRARASAAGPGAHGWADWVDAVTTPVR